MKPLPDDPFYLNSRRESIVTIVAWFICGVYTLSYCYLTGYGDPSEEVQTHWGIPDWVLFGIFLPWVLVNVFAWWYCFRFVKDEDLGEDPEERQAQERDELHGS